MSAVLRIALLVTAVCFLGTVLASLNGLGSYGGSGWGQGWSGWSAPVTDTYYQPVQLYTPKQQTNLHPVTYYTPQYHVTYRPVQFYSPYTVTSQSGWGSGQNNAALSNTRDAYPQTYASQTGDLSSVQTVPVPVTNVREDERYRANVAAPQAGFGYS